MSDKLRKSEEKRRELIEKIKQCELEKETIKNTALKLAAQYNIGEIDFYEYQKRYKNVFKDKTPEQLVGHLDIQIRTYQAQLNWYKKEIREATKTLKPIESKQSLFERIQTAEKYKKEVIDSVQDLATKYTNREITYQAYQKILQDKFGEKTPQQWVDYYDNYIKKCKDNLITYDHQIKKSRIKKVTLISAPLLLGIFILIYFLFGFFSQIAITGLTTKLVDEVHTEKLNLILNESSTHVFEIPYSGNLNWAKISGKIKEGGNVRIYLDDYLLLDSDSLEAEKIITGNVITGLTTEETDDSGSSSTESGSEDSSSNSEQDSSEASESPDESASEDSGADSQGEPPSNEEKPEEPPEETEQPTENPIEEQPETEPNETTEEPKKPQNETEIEEETHKSKEKISIKTFSDFCEETCDLKAFNLTKSSYTIRIEIKNAELVLDEIKYEITIEKEILELEENITEIPENITEISVPPTLTKEIPNILIEKNSFYDISIQEYFSGAEDFYLLQTPNISFTAFDHNIRIQPEENFTGTR